MSEIRLTQFSHGAGCACKLGPSHLVEVLERLNAVVPSDPALLVGSATGDDAAVYALDEDRALVYTVDFFTPIVDDPYDWGRIAATNALSDVYAMGGRPLLCLNIAAWPIDDLPAAMLGDVLAGGGAVAHAAGAIVVGGHTIDDREPKYGMAVIGLADPQRIMRNDAAKPGDVLVLTKPLGLGVISTGIKRGEVPKNVVDEAVTIMTTLNKEASEAAMTCSVLAATDVTGFGLLGHLHRMLLASGVAASVWASAVPVIDGARPLAEIGVVPGGTRRNIAFVAPHVAYEDGVPEPVRVLLADAQTSGGLLLCCPAESVDALRLALEQRSVQSAEIGIVEEGEPGIVRVRADR
ncbi:MAG: selenide, water dikinase SelD [Actinobacteria bacterium]|nr:selenide, water dikinase SelD [Actinomycetota bacterium]